MPPFRIFRPDGESDDEDAPANDAVIEHPSWVGRGREDTAQEYLLPCGSIPEDVKETLHPWLKKLVGMKSREVGAILDQRWAHIKQPCLQELAVRYKEFSPKSIVVYQGKGWLLLERPLPETYPQRYPRNLILIPPPVTDKSIAAGLAKVTFADSKTMRSFVRHFGAIHEMIPNHSADFWIPAKWETVYDRFGEDHGRYDPWYKDWSGALIVYGSSVGDAVLLHPSGKVAWWLFADHEIKPIADDFDGFINYYNDYLSKHYWPLDSCSPPSPSTYR